MDSTPPAMASSISPERMARPAAPTASRAGGAEPVERLAGNRVRQTCEQERHAGDVAVVLAGLVGTAEEDFVHLRPVEIGVFCHQRLDRGRRKIVGAHLGERAAETADRGPHGIADKDVTHRCSP
ncbi:hypothetical protein ACVIG9_005971 [Bradyrhizobium ottawaense]